VKFRLTIIRLNFKVFKIFISRLTIISLALKFFGIFTDHWTIY